MELWTAVTIGFLGSFHCIGMCGPIAMALPGKSKGTASLVVGRLLYNAGRIITYAFLGFIFGMIGQSVALAGFQKTLSIILGIAVIIGAVSQTGNFQQWKDKLGLDSLFEKLKSAISAQFKKRGQLTLFSIGLLNGLLPCGFVYVGLAGAVTTGSTLESSMFMALFGLGTLPAIFAVSMAPGFISLTLRRRINKAIPFLAIAFGLYLVFRGIAMSPGMH